MAVDSHHCSKPAKPVDGGRERSYIVSMKPGINREKVEVLKRRLRQDTELSQFWEYYFTHFAEQPSFHKMGSPCSNKVVEDRLRLVGQKLFGRDRILLEDLMLIEIPQFGLIHGACSLQGALASVLYFPEMKAGVIAVARSNGQMTYARITEPALESLRPATRMIQ